MVNLRKNDAKADSMCHALKSIYAPATRKNRCEEDKRHEKDRILLVKIAFFGSPILGKQWEMFASCKKIWIVWRSPVFSRNKKSNHSVMV